jgi:hypothetical protein
VISHVFDPVPDSIVVGFVLRAVSGVPIPSHDAVHVTQDTGMSWVAGSKYEPVVSTVSIQDVVPVVTTWISNELGDAVTVEPAYGEVLSMKSTTDTPTGYPIASEALCADAVRQTMIMHSAAHAAANILVVACAVHSDFVRPQILDIFTVCPCNDLIVP